MPWLKKTNMDFQCSSKDNCCISSSSPFASCPWNVFDFIMSSFFSDSVCSPHGNSLVLIKLSGILLWDIIYHGTVYHFPYLGHRCAGLYLETSFFSELSKNLWKGTGQQKSNYLQQTRIHSLWNLKDIQLFICPRHPLVVGNVIWLYLVQLKISFVPNFLVFHCYPHGENGRNAVLLLSKILILILHRLQY